MTREELKEKAQEYMKTGIEVRTLTLKAVDMHFIKGDISMLRIGIRVQILTGPARKRWLIRC